MPKQQHGLSWNVGATAPGECRCGYKSWSEEDILAHVKREERKKNCRFCQKPLEHIFLDLGFQPPSNSFLSKNQLEEPEVYYPLKAYICDRCWLVQVPENKKAAEIFNHDYPYYSSQSPANIAHAKEYVEMVTKRFNPEHVLEIGSNDGYLLQHFPNNISVIGIDAAEGPAKTANEKGIFTLTGFFTTAGSRRLLKENYDLICSINTIAHQPDINDFVEGIRIALAPNGVTTHEFPWLLKMVEGLQFDQFYHEHFSYFSLTTLCEIFLQHHLAIFDVEILPTHGGSLRIFAEHELGKLGCTQRLDEALKQERALGISSLSYYSGFQAKAEKVRSDFMRFLYNPVVWCGQSNGSLSYWFLGEAYPEKILKEHSDKSLSACKAKPLKICAYGAPAKANTFLNYCKVTPDLLPFTVDISPHKQGRYLPGSHIPVLTEEDLINYRPDYVLVLAWNIKEEIMEQLSYIRNWDGKFVIAIPSLEVI